MLAQAGSSTGWPAPRAPNSELDARCPGPAGLGPPAAHTQPPIFAHVLDCFYASGPSGLTVYTFGKL